MLRHTSIGAEDKMKLSTLLLLIISILSRPASGYSLELGEKLPALNAIQIADPENLFSSSKYKVTYIDFWAAWCSKCRSTLPWLNKIKQKQLTHKFQLITVNLDNEKESADQLLEKLQLSLPIIYDPEGKLAEQFDIKGLPAAFLVNTAGKVIGKWSGFNNSLEQEIEAAINNELNK